MVVASSPFFRVLVCFMGHALTLFAFVLYSKHVLLAFSLSLFHTHWHTHTLIKFCLPTNNGIFQRKTLLSCSEGGLFDGTSLLGTEERSGKRNLLIFFWGSWVFACFWSFWSWWSEKSSMNSFMNELCYGKCVGLL